MHAGGQGFESLILHTARKRPVIFDMLERRRKRETNLGIIQIPRVKEKREKGEGWIPWLMEAKKDVISCDKPRGSANTT